MQNAPANWLDNIEEPIDINGKGPLEQVFKTRRTHVMFDFPDELSFDGMFIRAFARRPEHSHEEVRIINNIWNDLVGLMRENNGIRVYIINHPIPEELLAA